MKHLDLFSGIGGFALACDWLDIETIGFVEIDPFCQKVLKKHWPDVPIVGDVRDVKVITDTTSRRYDRTQESKLYSTAKGQESDDNTSNGDSILLTAGFPCQPFSNAGRKRGSADDRYLWPATYEVIKSVKPDWIVLENVPGILNMVFTDSPLGVASQASLFGNADEIADYPTISGQIESDLREAGYETVWLVIPACSLNAPHRRDRVWIVANTSRARLYKPTQTRSDSQEGSREVSIWVGTERQDSHATNTSTEGLQRSKSEQPIRLSGQPDRGKSNEKPGWQENWYEVAAEFCRVDARIPDRVDRLKSLGNAIVPQVAYEIIKNIKHTDGALT